MKKELRTNTPKKFLSTRALYKNNIVKVLKVKGHQCQIELPNGEKQTINLINIIFVPGKIPNQVLNKLCNIYQVNPKHFAISGLHVYPLGKYEDSHPHLRVASDYKNELIRLKTRSIKFDSSRIKYKTFQNE